MKKILITLFFVLALPGYSQDLQNVISTLPESVIYGLDESGKTLLRSGLEDTTRITIPRGGGLGEITKLAVSSDFIAFQTSSSSSVEIKLLPLINDTKIICVVKTVCSGICDSQIQFYTMKWVPIAIDDLFPPVSKDSFIKETADRSDQKFLNAYAALDIAPVKLTFSPETTSMTLTFDIKNYLNKEEYAKVSPFLKEGDIILDWDKSSYKLR